MLSKDVNNLQPIASLVCCLVETGSVSHDARARAGIQDTAAAGSAEQSAERLMYFMQIYHLPGNQWEMPFHALPFSASK